MSSSFLAYSNKNIFCLSLVVSEVEPVSILSIGIINIYDKRSLKLFSDMVDFIRYLGDLPDKSFIYIHNLKFSYAFLYSYIKINKLDIIKSEFIVGENQSVMEVHLLIGDRFIYIRDLSLIVGGSLEDIFKDNIIIFDYKDLNSCLIGLSFVLKKRLGLSRSLTTSGAAKRDLLSTIRLTSLGKRVTFKKIDYITDKELRFFYRGGYNYLNSNYVNKELNDVTIIDKNSMYGFIMHSISGCSFPCGYPIYFEGVPDLKDLELFCVRVSFKKARLKDGYHPFIRDTLIFATFEREYQSFIEDGNIYYFTNYELELFLEYYEVEDINYLDGYYFNKLHVGLFDDYVDFYYKMRLKTRDNLVRSYAKLMLNALSGKFGERLDNKKFESCINKKGVQDFKELPLEEGKGFYLPIAIFITSQARYWLIHLIQQLGNDFIYCDTDSLHILNFEKHKRLFDIGTRLYEWKIEGFFPKSKYLKKKVYMNVDVEGKNHYTVSGVDASKLDISIEEFKLNMVLKNRKMEYVKGGAIYKDIDFRII